MSPVTSRELLLGLLSWMILTLVFGAITSWIWAIRRMARSEPILPREPLIERRKPAWGWGILLVLISFFVINVGGFTAYALATRGRPSRKHAEVKAAPRKADAAKPAAAAAVKDHAADQTPAPVATKPPAEADGAPGNLSWLEVMFVQAAINSTLIVLLPLLLRVASGVRLADIGLARRAWRRQVAIGVVGIVMVMPVVQLVNWASTYLPGIPRREVRAHPLEKMLRDDPTGAIAYLAVLSAVVLAPVSEELLFRGILQPWLIAALNDLALAVSRRRRSTPVPAPIPIPPPEGPPAGFEFWAVDEPEGADDWTATTSSAPAPLDAGPARAADEPTSYRPPVAGATAAAITLVSLLFGALHASQWPAPIPIFVLAVGLGLVSYRTGSLLSPICMHAIFNGISTVGILLTMHAPIEKSVRPVEPAAERVQPNAGRKGQVAPPHVDLRLQRGQKGISRQFFLDAEGLDC